MIVMHGPAEEHGPRPPITFPLKAMTQDHFFLSSSKGNQRYFATNDFRGP